MCGVLFSFPLSKRFGWSNKGKWSGNSHLTVDTKDLNGTPDKYWITSIWHFSPKHLLCPPYIHMLWFEVQCLAQRHCDLWIRGIGNWTSNPMLQFICPGFIVDNPVIPLWDLFLQCKQVQTYNCIGMRLLWEAWQCEAEPEHGCLTQKNKSL